MKKPKLLNSLLSLQLLLISSLTIQAQTYKYTITDLGAFSVNGATVALGINDNGQVTGRSEAQPGYPHAFIWLPDGPNLTSGSMKDLGLLTGTNLAVGMAINLSGTIAGLTGSTKNGITTYPKAARWNVNTLGNVFSIDAIKPFGGSQCQGYGINDAGQVVGWSSMAKAADGMHAFLWTNGSMVDIGAPPSGSDWRKALSINKKGVVVGLDGLGGWFRRIPADTAPTELPFITNAVNVDASNHDIIAGAANGRAILYDLTTSSFLPLTTNSSWASISSEARALNTLGQMVGISDLGAFVYDPTNGMQALNGMFAQPVGRTWVLQGATGINSYGQICGYGYTTDTGSTTKVYRAFLLTPNP